MSIQDKPRHVAEELDEYSWAPIYEFEEYFVNEEGTVWDTSRDQEVRQRWTDSFIVNLRNPSHASGQTTKRVCVLVAEAFVPREENRFNTVIFLDGDRRNHHANNLAWRPRSYAIHYHREMLHPEMYVTSYPVVDSNHIEHENSLEAAMANGICPSHVIKSLLHNRPEMLLGLRFMKTDF
jgi:hypothetical protein